MAEKWIKLKETRELIRVPEGVDPNQAINYAKRGQLTQHLGTRMEQLESAASGLGIELEPTEEVTDLSTRFALGDPRRELIEEQIADLRRGLGDDVQIQAIFPNREDPGDYSLAVRKPGDERYRLVDNPMNLGRGDVAEMAGGVTAGDIAGMATEVFLNKGKGLMARLARVAGAGVAKFGTDALISGGESATGYERTPYEDTLDQIATQTLVGMGGAGVFEGTGLAVDLARGLALRVGLSGWRAALGAVPDPPIPPTLSTPELRQIVSELPALTKFDMFPPMQMARDQAVSITATGRTAAINELKNFAEAVRRAGVIAGDPVIPNAELVGISDNLRRRLMSDLTPTTLPRGSDEIGPETFRALEQFADIRERAQLGLDGSVIRLANGADAAFRIGPSKARVHEALKGVLAPQETEEGLATALVPGTAPTGELATAMWTFLRMPNVLKTGTLGDEFAEGFKILTSLRDVAEGVIQSGTKNEAKINGAAVLRDAIDDILSKPRVGKGQAGQSARLRTALEESVAYRKETGEVFRALEFRQTLAKLNKNPEEMGRSLITPTHPDRVTYLHRALTEVGEDKWDAVRGAYADKLISNPKRIANELDSFPERTRRLLFTEDQESWLRGYQDADAAFESSSVTRITLAGNDMGEEAIEDILRQDTGRLEAFVEAAGGKDTPAVRSVQRGLFTSLFNRSVDAVPGGVGVLNRNRFVTNIRQLKQTHRADAVLTEDQIKFLDWLEERATFLPQLGGGDVGAQLRSASISSGMMGILTGRGLAAMQAGRKYIESDRIAWAIMTPEGRKWMQSNRVLDARPKSFPKTFGTIKGLAFALAAGATQAEEDARALYDPRTGAIPVETRMGSTIQLDPLERAAMLAGMR